jgi:para-aminobenzoate synthetase / 4-amino-4-deoxychorismate lyase
MMKPQHRSSTSCRVATEISRYPNEPSKIKIWLTDEQTLSTDPFRRHKTTRRNLYDKLYARARGHGFSEVIFTNEKGEITEGAVSNVFIEKKGEFLTPPLACGVLPGICRRHILETCVGSEEAVLTVDDLESADGIYLCSSLRGLRRVASFSTKLDE